MLLEAIYHSNEIPYIFPIGTNRLKIRIRAKRSEAASCTLLYSDRYVSPGCEVPMQLEKVAVTTHFDYFEGTLDVPTKRLRYLFLLTGHDGSEAWCGERGVSRNRMEVGAFQFAYICGGDIPVIPDWLHDAVIYHIFPERFHNGNPDNDPEGTLPWALEGEMSSRSWYGGDLQGVIDKMPYLAGLGINTLYLTPVFLSPSNHKYNTTDYYQIDPAFGDLDTLKTLVKLAHEHQIRVLLDAVFNHTGDTFFAFQDVLQRGADSPYCDWYSFSEYPVIQSPPNYEMFGEVMEMPKLNTNNPEVIAYFIDVAKYWIQEVGIDGWRLDVANEPDHRFWRALRQEVKALNPDATLIGEVMHYCGPWLKGDEFDGAMNYLLRDIMLDFFAKQQIGVSSFVEQVAQLQMSYTDQANEAMMQIIDSHDTERFLSSCLKGGWGWNKEQSAEKRMRLAVLFQFTYLGMPMVYYGDEIGMSGNTDPDCRRPMLWNAEEHNAEMDVYYRRLIALRREVPALARGDYRLWFADESRNTFGFFRTLEGQRVAVIFNNSPVAFELGDELAAEWNQDSTAEAITGETYARAELAQVTVAPYSGIILI